MERARTVKLCLAGDVMTGRGIDQILPHPNDPVLYEAWVRSATEYVRLAEAKNGRIPRRVGDDYVWGELLPELLAADVRVVNLETAVTTSATPYPKGINYRMHPAHVGVLRAARVDCCVLANNHVLDWQVPGLLETLDTLAAAGIRTAGAGRDAAEAERPAEIQLEVGGRVVVHAFGHASSGIPSDWAAAPGRPGVALDELTEDAARRIAQRIARARRPGDLTLVSVHWGGNWGWDVPDAHRRFARALIGEGGVDLVHGHSSHHPLGVELIDGRPVLYGCGDLIDDYEGIDGYEAFRPDVSVLVVATHDRRSLALERLELVPVRRRRFRLERARGADLRWLERSLARECARLGTRLVREGDRLCVEVTATVG